MIKLNQVSLLDILPSNLTKDKSIIAAAKSIDKECIKILNEIDKKLILSNIDNINEDKIIDALALESHVDFYNQNLSLDIKKNIVKNSLYLHRIKGTKTAVENLVNTVFGDGKVVEWFEYGGEPFYFKVITENSALATTEIENFISAIETVKNARSKLEKIEIHYKMEKEIKYGCIISDAEKITIEMEAWK